MLKDSKIDRAIGAKLLAENQRKEHRASGKLSASMLGLPLQWQILKVLSVPKREIDEYTIRKFLRGNQIEDWLVRELEGVQERQKLVEYRGAIGFIDAIVDSAQWDFPKGVIPVEVKSISNAKYRHLLKEGSPQVNHQLQAGFYALATGSEWFAICYVAADDLRVETFILPTGEIKSKIDKLIDDFNVALTKARESGEIPIFQAKEEWQNKVLYSPYPDWQSLTQQECNQKFKELN